MKVALIILLSGIGLVVLSLVAFYLMAHWLERQRKGRLQRGIIPPREPAMDHTNRINWLSQRWLQ